MNINRMKTAVSVLAMTAALALKALDGAAYQALQAINDDVVSELSGVKALDGKTIAVLPIASDESGLFGDMLRISLTTAGKKCVTGKEDPVFAEIVKEITWDAYKSDILDEKTVSKFGKL